MKWCVVNHNLWCKHLEFILFFFGVKTLFFCGSLCPEYFAGINKMTYILFRGICQSFVSVHQDFIELIVFSKGIKILETRNLPTIKKITITRVVGAAMTSNGGVSPICCNPVFLIQDLTIVKLGRKFPLPVILIWVHILEVFSSLWLHNQSFYIRE